MIGGFNENGSSKRVRSLTGFAKFAKRRECVEKSRHGFQVVNRHHLDVSIEDGSRQKLHTRPIRLAVPVRGSIHFVARRDSSVVMKRRNGMLGE